MSAPMRRGGCRCGTTRYGRSWCGLRVGVRAEETVGLAVRGWTGAAVPSVWRAAAAGSPRRARRCSRRSLWAPTPRPPPQGPAPSRRGPVADTSLGLGLGLRFGLRLGLGLGLRLRLGLGLSTSSVRARLGCGGRCGAACGAARAARARCCRARPLCSPGVITTVRGAHARYGRGWYANPARTVRGASRPAHPVRTQRGRLGRTLRRRRGVRVRSDG